ncbi:hypothetical protein ACEQ8H_002159 [Pleosporales sp. CAS-2024a]
MKSTIIFATLLAVAFGAPSKFHHRRQAGTNFQTFTGALGGIAATPVTDSGNPQRKFQVKGDTFVNLGAALQRSCDQQFNACANAANGGNKSLNVGACEQQHGDCSSNAQSSGNTQSGNTQSGSTQSGSTQPGNPKPKSCKKKRKN